MLELCLLRGPRSRNFGQGKKRIRIIKRGNPGRKLPPLSPIEETTDEHYEDYIENLEQHIKCTQYQDVAL